MTLEQMLDPMAQLFNDYGMVIGDVHRVAAKYVRMVIVQKAMNLTSGEKVTQYMIVEAETREDGAASNV